MKDEYQNKEQDRRLGELENHWTILNDEFGKIKDGMSEVKTNQEWIMKTYWILTSAVLTSLVGTIMLLITKR